MIMPTKRRERQYKMSRVDRTKKKNDPDRLVATVVKSKIKRSISRKKPRLVRKKRFVPKIRSQSPGSETFEADTKPIVSRVKRRRARKSASSDQDDDADYKPNGIVNHSALGPKRRCKRSRRSSSSHSRSALLDDEEDLEEVDNVCECPELNRETLKQFGPSFAVTCPTLNAQRDLDELAINLVGAFHWQFHLKFNCPET